MTHKTFAIHTLGCKVNQEEAAAIAAAFLEAGYREVPFPSAADIYIVNTCTVTSLADRKSRAMIRRARKANPDALVVAAGCYVQVSPEEVQAIGGVDLILGVDERAKLPQLFAKEEDVSKYKSEIRISDVLKKHDFVPLPMAKEKQKRARAFLKIQDGCDQFCHYCIIPYARGASRSLPEAEVLKRAQSLIKLGHREIVLSGIHIGVYGKELIGGENLNSLIEKILELPGLGRLRLGSLEIQHIDDGLIAMLAGNKKLCPHLHIPVQSGSDAVLKAMGRRYTVREYEDVIVRIREQLPAISITTDVIVGFPGEGEEEFNQTYEFCQKTFFSKMHIFPFSPRKRTRAYEMKDKVPDIIKKARAKRLASLDRSMQNAYGKKFIGQSLSMLVEEEIEIGRQKYWLGHSGNYLSLLLPYEELEKGSLLPVLGTAWQKNSLYVKKEKEN